MSFFTKHYIDRLYIGEQTPDDKGYIAFTLPAQVTPPVSGISLDDALHSSALSGTFVFSAIDFSIDSTDKANKFVDAVYNIISPYQRALLWAMEPENLKPESTCIMGINEGGTQVNSGLQVPITLSLLLQVQNGMALNLNNATLVLGNSSGPKIKFTGPSAPNQSDVTKGTLDFSGPLRGCIQYSQYLERRSLYDDMGWGFQFLYPVYNEGVHTALSEWQPLASGIDPSPSDMLGFDISIDPTDIFNTAYDPCGSDISCHIEDAYNCRRTFFNFTGKNFSNHDTILVSYYKTIFGKTITLLPIGNSQKSDTLLPGRLVFELGENISPNQKNFHISPEGDFVLKVVNSGEGTTHRLLCGLEGTEFISFTSKNGDTEGDRIRFVANQAAYAPHYPFQDASPVGPPTDLASALLNKTYRTSWGTIINGAACQSLYVAQPKGSSLYGHDTLIYPKYQELIGQKTPGGPIPQTGDLIFPVPPYAGLIPGDGTNCFDENDVQSFESQIIEPTRRATIGKAQIQVSQAIDQDKAKESFFERAATFNATTPSGQLATVMDDGNGNCKWIQILLGQNLNPQPLKFYFNYPTIQLAQAFQTNQVFLVVANNKYIGTLGGDTDPTMPGFFNTINIEDWAFAANVGIGNKYNDYRNIIIIKGRKGKLYDPKGDNADNLVSNPQRWTQRNDFASPTTDSQDLPDPTQQVILSQWLQSYFKDASEQTDTTYFQKFNSIATDENWTGILILRMDIKTIPQDLAGITAGVTDPSAFNAHHFGIEISQVKNDSSGVDIKDSSSMFGLIYYVDPEYNTAKPESPVPPAAGTDYAFRLLTLKVLFRNTAIIDFSSYAQLTLNRFFDTAVDHMGIGGNLYNTIVLKGSYQNNDGNPVYNMNTFTTNTFYLNSNIINKVEIDGVQMITRNSGADGNPIVTWFAMGGFIDYFVISQQIGNDTQYFDIFAFGNNPGDDYPRKGLNFSNLGILMTTTGKPPNQDTVYIFDSEEIQFDISTSTARADSLFINFALQLQGLIAAKSDAAPSSLGYLNISTDFRFQGVDKEPWCGLSYNLKMGTPGNLAGDVGLNSSLLTAWAPDSAGKGAYKALVGIKLPGTGGGASLISLQNVLKLSIGQIRLVREKDPPSFLMMFIQIALKFLGFLKLPPNGSTLFYLFGNPESKGKPSGLGWYAMYKQTQK